MSTARAISPDSGEIWTHEGAWPAAPGVHRIPLPLPNDGLKAVNVYAIETADGLVLVDGGWAIPEARATLERGLGRMGAALSDVCRFLVTHVHRDHYSLARVLATEYGVPIALGAGDELALESSRTPGRSDELVQRALIEGGAAELADRWVAAEGGGAGDPSNWTPPDEWLTEDRTIDLGSRLLSAVHTPGHTPGHFVFADTEAGILFSGDHILPTITPSVGFVFPPPAEPLLQFMTSLARVRALPDLIVLPAHGPVAPSSHARSAELHEHHEQRLAACRALLDGAADNVTARQVAGGLGWTRDERPFHQLDLFNQALATLETKAHLDLLVARGSLAERVDADIVHYHPAARSIFTATRRVST